MAYITNKTIILACAHARSGLSFCACVRTYLLSHKLTMEPRGRAYHGASVANSRLYVWGGNNEHTEINSSTVEEFNIFSTSWQEPQDLKNLQLPHGLQ